MRKTASNKKVEHLNKVKALERKITKNRKKKSREKPCRKDEKI